MEASDLKVVVEVIRQILVHSANTGVIECGGGCGGMVRVRCIGSRNPVALQLWTEERCRQGRGVDLLREEVVYLAKGGAKCVLPP